MKDKIKRLHLPHLRNEDHLGFHSEFNHLVKGYSHTETFQALFVIYQGCLKKLEASLKAIRKSTYTRLLVSADRQRSATYRSLRSAIQGYLRHASLEKQQVAIDLGDIIRHYGNIPRMSRDEKTYAMTNMLQDLLGKIPNESAMPGIRYWATELAASNDSYKNLKELRYDEWEKQAELHVKTARKSLDFAYHSLVRQMEIHGVLNPSDTDFISLSIAVNERLESYGRLIAQRNGIRAYRNSLPQDSLPDSASTPAKDIKMP